MYVLTAEQAREADRLTLAECGLTNPQLMEAAAAALAGFLTERYADALPHGVGMLCGPGNNGGDGRLAARILARQGVRVELAELAKADDGAGWEKQRDAILRCGVVVDALFGTGLARPLGGVHATAVEALNSAFPRPVVAVDLPSGLGTPGVSVKAAATVTFTAPKTAHFLLPDSERCGAIRVAQIGTPAGIVTRIVTSRGAQLQLAGPWLCAPFLAPRAREGHKGSYGHVVVVGGAPGKTGAAAMAAFAALRAGAGLATVAAPPDSLPTIAGHHAEIMCEALTAGHSVILAGASVLALGPGAGTAPEMAERLRAWAREARVPCVVDADGLNAFDGRLEDLHLGAGGVLTPHPGEMARLLGRSTGEVQRDRLGCVRRLAAETGAAAVLKGHRTLTCAPDGAAFINTSGNPGMATGGAGDVLTGIVAGLLAQFPQAALPEVAAAAVYLHGRAGDRAAAVLGEMCVVAGDLLQYLPAAMQEAAHAKPWGDVVDIAA